MAGLVPAIHVCPDFAKDVDARYKPGMAAEIRTWTLACSPNTS